MVKGWMIALFTIGFLALGFLGFSMLKGDSAPNSTTQERKLAEELAKVKGDVTKLNAQSQQQLQAANSGNAMSTAARYSGSSTPDGYYVPGR